MSLLGSFYFKLNLKYFRVLLPEEVLEETETYCVKAKNWSVPVIVQEELLTHGNGALNLIVMWVWS